MVEKDFNKNVAKNKHIHGCETIQQFYLVSFILEEKGLTDMTYLKEKIKFINRYEIELIAENNKKTRYIYNEEKNKIQIKTIL